MLTGKEAWDIVKRCSVYKLPYGYAIHYRSTKYSEWVPAEFRWCILRNYFYKSGKDTGQRSYELCLGIRYPDLKYPITHFIHELDESDFNRLGVEFVNIGEGI